MDPAHPRRILGCVALVGVPILRGLARRAQVGESHFLFSGRTRGGAFRLVALFGVYSRDISGRLRCTVGTSRADSFDGLATSLHLRKFPGAVRTPCPCSGEGTLERTKMHWRTEDVVRSSIQIMEQRAKSLHLRTRTAGRPLFACIVVALRFYATAAVPYAAMRRGCDTAPLFTNPLQRRRWTFRYSTTFPGVAEL